MWKIEIHLIFHSFKKRTFACCCCNLSIKHSKPLLSIACHKLVDIFKIANIALLSSPRPHGSFLFSSFIHMRHSFRHEFEFSTSSVNVFRDSRSILKMSYIPHCESLNVALLCFCYQHRISLWKNSQTSPRRIFYTLNSSLSLSFVRLSPARSFRNLFHSASHTHSVSFSTRKKKQDFSVLFRSTLIISSQPLIPFSYSAKVRHVYSKDSSIVRF